MARFWWVARTPPAAAPPRPDRATKPSPSVIRSIEIIRFTRCNFPAETVTMHYRATEPRDQILPVLPRDREDLLAPPTGQLLAEATRARKRFHPA